MSDKKIEERAKERNKSKHSAHAVILEKFNTLIGVVMNSGVLLLLGDNSFDEERKLQDCKANGKIKLLLLMDILKGMIIPEKAIKDVIKQFGMWKKRYVGILEKIKEDDFDNEPVYKKMNALIKDLSGEKEE